MQFEKELKQHASSYGGKHPGISSTLQFGTSPLVQKAPLEHMAICIPLDEPPLDEIPPDDDELLELEVVEEILMHTGILGG